MRADGVEAEIAERTSTSRARPSWEKAPAGSLPKRGQAFGKSSRFSRNRNPEASRQPKKPTSPTTTKQIERAGPVWNAFIDDLVNAIDIEFGEKPPSTFTKAINKSRGRLNCSFTEEKRVRQSAVWLSLVVTNTWTGKDIYRKSDRIKQIRSKKKQKAVLCAVALMSLDLNLLSGAPETKRMILDVRRRIPPRFRSPPTVNAPTSPKLQVRPRPAPSQPSLPTPRRQDQDPPKQLQDRPHPAPRQPSPPSPLQRGQDQDPPKQLQDRPHPAPRPPFPPSPFPPHTRADTTVMFSANTQPKAALRPLYPPAQSYDRPYSPPKFQDQPSPTAQRYERPYSPPKLQDQPYPPRHEHPYSDYPPSQRQDYYTPSQRQDHHYTPLQRYAQPYPPSQRHNPHYPPPSQHQHSQPSVKFPEPEPQDLAGFSPNIQQLAVVPADLLAPPHQPDCESESEGEVEGCVNPAPEGHR